MKTIILFSSFFYLLGLKLGNTVEIVKKIAIPVSAIFSTPADKPAESGKSYHYDPGKSSTDKPETKKPEVQPLKSGSEAVQTDKVPAETSKEK